MRKTCTYLTAACFVWMFVMFPAVGPVHAQATAQQRIHPDDFQPFTWASPDGIDVTFTPTKAGYELTYVDTMTGETMHIELTPPSGRSPKNSSALALRIDGELDLLYRGADPLNASALRADTVRVQFRGRELVDTLMPPALSAAMDPASPPEMPPAMGLMTEALKSLHDADFYAKIGRANDTLLDLIKSHSSETGAIAKAWLPWYVYCLANIVGWTLSWACFLAGCATIIACFGCAGIHVWATVQVAESCTDIKDDLRSE